MATHETVKLLVTKNKQQLAAEYSTCYDGITFNLTGMNGHNSISVTL